MASSEEEYASTGSQKDTNELLQQLIAAMAQQQKSQGDILQALLAQNAPTASHDPQAPGPGPQSNRGQMLPDPNKPSLLETDTTLEEFDGWRDIWNDYSACVGLDKLLAPQQLARFRTFLSPDMRSELSHGIGISDSDSLDTSAVLDQIRAYIRGKRNVALDRVAFEERRQTEGESFDSFYIGLKKIAANADLCEHCYDARLATRIMVGLGDQETRKKLLAMKPFPSVSTVIDLCRSEESGRKNEEVLEAKCDSRSISKTQKAHQQDRPRFRGRSKAPAQGNGDAKCGFCGLGAHDRRSCPASDAVCNACGSKGHYARVCREGVNRDRVESPRVAERQKLEP